MNTATDVFGSLGCGKVDYKLETSKLAPIIFNAAKLDAKPSQVTPILFTLVSNSFFKQIVRNRAFSSAFKLEIKK